MRIYMKIAKKTALSLCVFLLTALLGGCSPKGDGIEENLLGIRKSDYEKQIITISCNMELKNFAQAVEERFPEIRLIQDCYTGEFRISEHMAHIDNNDFGDIIMVKAGHIHKVDLSGVLMDLSTQPFPANYTVSALPADEEGHILLIPGPLSFNCNIYNKTLFEENNWQVPDSYEEFLTLCQKIDQTGIRGFRNVYFDSGSQSYQIYNYCMISALDTLTQVEGQTWHNKLMAGEKVSLEPLGTAFEDMGRMMEAGLIRQEDLEFTVSMREEALLDRRLAISEGEIDHIQMLNSQGEDEFSFMPHFSMTDGQGWLLNLGYYFGVNKKLQKPENEKKWKAVMDIMSFIASEEGQRLLTEDKLGMIPATRAAGIPDNPILQPIRKQIENGRYIMRPGYEMFTPVLETEIAAFLRRETDSQTILEKCSLLLEQEVLPPQSFGEAKENFTVLQTGCLKADALRAAGGTDVALIGMSEIDCYDPVGGTRTKLYKGPVIEDDVIRIAQVKTDQPIMCVNASVTGEQLLALLEYGATSADEQEQGTVNRYHPFAVSGLTLTYGLEEKEGERVLDVRLSDGGKLEPDSLYTVSYLEGAIPKGKLQEMETGITMTDALKNYILGKKNVAPDRKRIRFK